MEEKLKICPGCSGICLIDWKFCCSCGTEVENEEKHVVKYAFISMDTQVLKPFANTLEELLRSQGSFLRVFSGLFIIKFFEFNLTATNAFAPIAVFLQSDKPGVYHQVSDTFPVIPPTK